MHKVRILFDISGHDTWIGGVYYMRNIIYQICNSDELRYICTPVIVYSTKFRNMFDVFENVAELHMFEENSKLQRLLALLKAIRGVDWIYYYHQYKFDPLNLMAKKAINWIPDFQECYYPKFFTDEQLSTRKKRGEHAATVSNPLVLSSNSCLEDFKTYFPAKKQGKVYVVPFVSAIEDEIRCLNEDFCEDILVKHNLQGTKYVLVSNQFWQHKNHIVVFQAIAKAKELGLLDDVKFVFTGELKDYRNADYYQKLVNIINDNGIKKNMLILGFIDRSEQLALMHKAQIVLQPSLFEGWGTVVEDSKVLDKTIVLSDIPVHREQMNEKCHLFNANDPDDLLKVLKYVLSHLEEDDVEKGISLMRQNAANYCAGLKELIKG